MAGIAKKTKKLSKLQHVDYYVDLDTDKQKIKFIKRIEGIVRSSMEYRDYIRFCKDNMDMSSCIFLSNVSQDKSRGRKRISVELHHEPFTLMDIVWTVVNRYEEEGLPYNDLLIADEVLELHYLNMVGLVPLSKTMHQVVHNSDKIKIPLYVVYGVYSDFVEKYGDYMEPELFDKLEKKVNFTKSVTKEDFDAIQKEFTYLEIDGVEDIQKLDIDNNNVEIDKDKEKEIINKIVA
ncbi:hypothetical protein IKN40_06625 [bacterium]|nr:hypothetical protein [bacterium]